MARKNIIIPYRGPIFAKGGVFGPINNPYSEDTTTIFRMLAGNVKVIEVLKDGTQLELNLSNFDKDNEKKEEKNVQAIINKQPEQKPSQQNNCQKFDKYNNRDNKNFHGKKNYQNMNQKQNVVTPKVDTESTYSQNEVSTKAVTDTVLTDSQNVETLKTVDTQVPNTVVDEMEIK